jgi:3-hydroxybutyryl-CoA dehydrogenase
VNVAVIGAGIMGSGIAQISAAAGHDVWLLDVAEEPLERARATVERSLRRLARRKALTEAEAGAAIARIGFTTDLAQAVAQAGIVVEAVPEDLALKQRVMADVAALAPETCLLATNTSQLSITAIGELLGDAAERVVGTHFFNPPAVMRLVELIAGDLTSDESLQRATDFARGLGRETVLCRKDVPGFITTRCVLALRLECLRIMEEGVASAEDIDKAIRLGLNHPMGPLELGDLVGLDTFLRNADSLHEAHGERFAVPAFARELIESGHLGRKTGRGFYEYDADGNPIEPDEQSA